jgi:hypothetical protein
MLQLRNNRWEVFEKRRCNNKSSKNIFAPHARCTLDRRVRRASLPLT